MSETKPKTLMLIPSVAKQGVADAVREDRHPTMDYYALQERLKADILDFSAFERDDFPRLAKISQRAGNDAALAMLGYLRRNEYDVIFSNSESVSIPLAFLLKRHHKRPRHVLIGHRLTPPKKRPFFRALHPQMDAIFVYSEVQREYAIHQLGIPAERLHLIPFHADQRFYRPIAQSHDAPDNLISGAGLEWRDYPTLIEAVRGLDVELRLGAASPWSKHRNETEDMSLPPNVKAQRYDYFALRQLYADSRFIVVPLYENDFQAGITTILEGMAMGKAVISTRTQGSANAIRHGENGLLLPPGDTKAWRSAIQELLTDRARTEQMGQVGRMDIERGMGLEHWVDRIANVIQTFAPDTHLTTNRAKAH